MHLGLEAIPPVGYDVARIRPYNLIVSDQMQQKAARSRLDPVGSRGKGYFYKGEKIWIVLIIRWSKLSNGVGMLGKHFPVLKLTKFSNEYE